VQQKTGSRTLEPLPLAVCVPPSSQPGARLARPAGRRPLEEAWGASDSAVQPGVSSPAELAAAGCLTVRSGCSSAAAKQGKGGGRQPGGVAAEEGVDYICLHLCAHGSSQPSKRTVRQQVKRTGGRTPNQKAATSIYIAALLLLAWA
jgi:hypothetical protein